MNQKDQFLLSEADAWYERNRTAVSQIDYSSDPVVTSIVEIAKMNGDLLEGRKLQILEIGCGEGWRLAWIADNLNVDVFGIEPSSQAVKQACAKGVKAERGTADELPFNNGTFDVLIFGFCLYLCDRHDLFRIAQEADRVLNPNGWIVINDFFSPDHIKREYHHQANLYTYKMDYRELFSWHPAYTNYSHKLHHHVMKGFTDDPQEWVATSIMRKKSDYL